MTLPTLKDEINKPFAVRANREGTAESYGRSIERERINKIIRRVCLERAARYRQSALLARERKDYVAEDTYKIWVKIILQTVGLERSDLEEYMKQKREGKE